jgi:hypothetical protein
MVGICGNAASGRTALGSPVRLASPAVPSVDRVGTLSGGTVLQASMTDIGQTKSPGRL